MPSRKIGVPVSALPDGAMDLVAEVNKIIVVSAEEVAAKATAKYGG